MKSEIRIENIIEVQRILELAAVRMAAERRTLEDLREVKIAHSVYYDQTLNYGSAVEEDLLFHLKIVIASKNNVLISLFMKMIPDMIVLFKKIKKQNVKEIFKAIQEHENIIEHIENQNIEAAMEAMRLHLKN